jgi:hypothetical protein
MPIGNEDKYRLGYGEQPFVQGGADPAMLNPNIPPGFENLYDPNVSTGQGYLSQPSVQDIGGGGAESSGGMSPEGAMMAGAAIKGGAQAANKLIGTILMMGEMEKDRLEKREAHQMETDLAKKSMVLEYLLGSKNYANKIRLLNAKLSASARGRAKAGSALGARGTARKTR